MENQLRIFFIESPSPLDLLQNRTEVKALEEICLILGFEVKRFFINSKHELIQHLNYISSIFQYIEVNDETPLCIHISAHGNERGLEFGIDFIEWKSFLAIIQPIYKASKNKDIIIVFSACEAGKQKTTIEFQKLYQLNKNISPPKYLFTTGEDDVAWEDALIAWSNFYHQMSKISMSEKTRVQSILNKIKLNCQITLKYFRWDKKSSKYFAYTAKDK